MRLLIAICLSLLWMLVGCSSRTEEAPIAQEANDPLLLEIERARDDVARFRASAEAQTKNREAHQEALAKARRVFDGLGIATRIPRERDDASIQAALDTAATAAEMHVDGLTITPRARESRALPAQVETGEEHRFREDDLREVLELQFTLTPADVGKLEVFDRELLGPAARRFVVLTRVETTPRHFVAHAEAYRFIDITPPRVVAVPPSEEEILARAELQRLLPARRGEPAVRDAISHVHDDLTALDGVVAQANEALRPIGEANLVVAQTAILQRRASEASQRSVADLLERGATPN